jgi:hydroxyacylglutathione hydrolase
VSWIVFEEGEEDPVILFSGGSLLVGGAGRTDLLGEQWTQELTRKQFDSIQRINQLPTSVEVLPTHGAGSFCASGSERKERVTTIGTEQQQNRLMTLISEELFAQKHLANQPSFPAYYAHMAPINRNGPAILKSLPSIAPLEVTQLEQSNAWILDMRNRNSFAAAHIRGSINIELEESFGTYAGWIVPFGATLILIADADNQAEQIKEAVTQLIRIGYENIDGYLDSGLDNWISSGRPVQSYDTGSIQDLCNDYKTGKLRLIDVRQKTEWDEAHAKNSVHAFVGNLQRDRPVLSDEQWSVACASGYRSAIAASILDAKGVNVRLISADGVPDFLKLCPEAIEITQRAR